MSIVKNLFRSACGALPLPAARRLCPFPLLLPYHHLVSDAVVPHVSELYAYKNRRQFEEDLDWLLQHYVPVSFGDVRAFVIEGKALPPNAFLLSFDDGFREVAEVIAPLLLRKGVPAVFFINPSFVNNDQLFYRCKLSLLLHEIRKKERIAKRFLAHLGIDTTEALRQSIRSLNYRQQHKADEWGQLAEIDFSGYLKKVRPFLTEEELHSLAGAGFTIGGHSMDHPHYGLLDAAAQDQQTLDSVAYAQHFNAAKTFAFPHEDKPAAQSLLNTLRSNGILSFGTRNQRTEAGNPILHRFNAEDPSIPFPELVKSMYVYNSLLSLAGKRAVKRS